MLEPKISEPLQLRVKAFGSKLSPEQKEEFIELMSDTMAEVAVEVSQEARTLLQEAKSVMSRNLLTLMR